MGWLLAVAPRGCCNRNYGDFRTMKHIHAMSKHAPAPARLPNPNVPPKLDRAFQFFELMWLESPKLEIKFP